jgi:hypothetical protein
MNISSHDGFMDRMELVFFTSLRSRVGGPPHDAAHGAFMTLPPYAGTREDDGRGRHSEELLSARCRQERHSIRNCEAM